MFMLSGQVFSHGESCRAVQTPAAQRCSRMCCSYSRRKCLSVVSTGFGAVWPRPHRLASRTTWQSASSRSRSSSTPSPRQIFSSRLSICLVPTRHGGHLPQDSSQQNSRKNRATSTMQESSSMTTRPPEPMMEPSFWSASYSRGVSSRLAGMTPPDGPPDCTALNCLPFGGPPPISKMMSRNGVPKGTSARPVLVDLAGEREDLRALGLLGADGGVPRAAAADDDGHRGPGFHVVDVGGLAPQTGLRRERRTRHGLAAAAFDGPHERGFLAAHKRAGADAQFDVEIESACRKCFCRARRACSPGQWRSAGV